MSRPSNRLVAVIAFAASACGRLDMDPPAAPLVFVQDNAVSNGSVGQVTVAFSVDQVAHDTIVAVVTFESSLQRIVDSSGNHYQMVVGPTNGGTTQQSICVAADIAAAPAGQNAVTVETMQSDNISLRVFEYGGLDGIVDVDPTSNRTGSGTMLDSGTITTTTPDLLFAATWCNSGIAAGDPAFMQRPLFETTLVDELVSEQGDTFHASVTAAGSGDAVIQLVPFRRTTSR